MSRKVVFKTYNQGQLSLLPPSYDDLVPSNHPVRIVNTIIDHIDISSLEKTYKGGGASSYHPRMLLKVLIYSYLRNTYSSRKIEQALHENVHFMWLSGQSKPDHNTINDFRGKRLKGHLKKIFNQVVLLLAAEGHLSLKDLYVDGTKLEANANRYTFVWGKSIATNKSKMKKQLADAGYGSEENYTDLENKDIEAFVKYNYFHKEQVDAKRGKINPFHPDNLYYNQQTDTYYCPMGQAMEKVREHKQKTKTGFEQTIHSYQAKNCQGCNLRSLCHKAKTNRIIQRNHNLIRLKQQAKEKLLSEDGIAHRKRRCWDVEAVFGNIKQNMNFKRFTLRGLEKVETEIGLIAMAHNLKKAVIAL